MGVVELPRYQSPAVPPVEQAVTALFDDTLQLGGQAAEIGESRVVSLRTAPPAQRCRW